MHALPPDGVELEDRPCPNGCTAGDEPVLEGHDRIHGIPGRYRVVRCRGCDLIRTNPRPTAATIGAYYPDDYGPYVSTQVAIAPSAIPAWRRRLRRILGMEARRLPPVAAGRLLEIGCASGAFLSEMRDRGWDVEGIEFSDAAARQARAAGLKVQTGSLESAQPPQESVDLIAAWMVLEHLHEPIPALKLLRRWVKPDGWLVASVPDTSAFARRVFGEWAYDLHLPNHLYHYTPATIAKLLDASGWRLTRVIWQRNANTLLWSAEYLASERGRPALARLARWLRTARGARVPRTLLAWLLGVTRESGRIEIWARPAPNVRNG